MECVLDLSPKSPFRIFGERHRDGIERWSARTGGVESQPVAWLVVESCCGTAAVCMAQVLLGWLAA